MVHGHPVTYLVDANVLSEATKPAPNARGVAWLRAHAREFAVDPVILGELRFETGLRWASLLADLRRKGLAMPIKDSLIAATALVHGLTVVTRNQADFVKAGVELLDPFQPA
jgi:predicted nucleic acid-binding protein